MGMRVSGRLHALFETRQVTERFQKREFVLALEDNPQYPQYVLFELSGKRLDALDGFAVGDAVEVEFNLRGREWTGRNGEVKYFNSLDVWSIEPVGGKPRPRDEPPPRDPQAPFADDDVPF